MEDVRNNVRGDGVMLGILSYSLPHVTFRGEGEGEFKLNVTLTLFWKN